MRVTPSWPVWSRSAARYTVGALVTAAIVFTLAMPSEPAAWSVVALVVVLGATTGQSVTAAVNRMAGSVVGCLTGATVQVTLPWLWLPLRVALAVVACMLICRLLRLTAGQRLGMALAGFFVFVPGDEEWQTVGWRLLATLIGITIALIITLVMWPATARDRLTAGIDDTLAAIAWSLEADGARLRGEDVPAPPPPPPPSALRPLVAERRFEPPGRGPDATTMSGVLDGLDIAVVGVQRLGEASAPGPQFLAVALAPDLGAVIDGLVDACEALRARLAGEPGQPLHLSGLDPGLSSALENLRSTHLTLAADAAELRALFAAVEALSLVGSGLARADSSFSAGARH